MTSEAHVARVQQIAAEVLAAVVRPIVVRGLAYVRFACCDAPAHARAWAVEEARVAARMWEAMAAGGAIETAWLATPTRQFACSVCFRRARHDRVHNAARPTSESSGTIDSHHRHEACPVCHGEALVAPPTCEGVVAIASAAASVPVIEQCARALAVALTPWGAREISTIIWRFRDKPRSIAPVPLRLAAAAAAVAVATRPPGGSPRSIASDDDRRAAWRDAVAANARVAPHPRGRPWPAGSAFGALADPFSPLDAIRAAGCALEDLTSDDAVLAIPPVPLAGERFADLLEIDDWSGRRPAARS
jgi:hypothetical protein